MTLNQDQEQAFKLIKDGKSVCLTGPGGAGKTFLIRFILRELSSDILNSEDKNTLNSTQDSNSLLNTAGRRKIAVTAMTGIASTYINGTTLHSWAGIPVRQIGKVQILKAIMSKADSRSTNTAKYGDDASSELSEEAQIIKRWRETDLLIIDEVSMMSAEVLNKLDYLGRNIREVNKPFGGLQLLLSGDFCQLPPIGNNERYCFESQVWQTAIAKTFALKQIVRQSDPHLQSILNEVREGKITMNGKSLLNSRLLSVLEAAQMDNESVDLGATSSAGSCEADAAVAEALTITESISAGPCEADATSPGLAETLPVVKYDSAKNDSAITKGIRPTQIYPHKERVNTINTQKFEELLASNAESGIEMGTQIFSYSFNDTVTLKPHLKGKVRPDIPQKELEEFLDQHCNAEKELQLCLGCQVMLTVNMDLEGGLVNGLTGIITNFEEGLPVMSYNAISGLSKTVKIPKWTWAPDHPRYYVKRSQIPLILAWAITVHRSQGATLNCVQADLREAFGPGMAYVILSRIRSLQGLYLEGINYSKIKCDPRVLAFYKSLK